MKRAVKWCAIAILLALLGSWVASLWTGYSLYFTPQEPAADPDQKTLAKGDIVSPLEGLDFNSGDWTAYIVLSPHDFSQLKGKVSRNCLKLTDRETMKRMQDEWKMVCTGGDMATVVSSIIFLKDNKVAFSSGLSLNEDLEGLQSRSFGWIEPKNQGIMWQYCSKFKPVYWPIVIL